MAYCVPDSIALLLGEDKEKIRKDMAPLGVGGTSRYVKATQFCAYLATKMQGEWHGLYHPQYSKLPKVGTVVAQRFKRGPYLMSVIFKVGRGTACHMVYVNEGLIYCNGRLEMLGEKATWFADYDECRAFGIYVPQA